MKFFMSRKKEFRNCFYNKCGVFLVYLFAYKTCPSTLISSVLSNEFAIFKFLIFNATNHLLDI
ncbi:hypothetical protein DERP_004351 [Dermatophagoides pteronyssinus]|uniref:Uncharacterized protein n=1 Tax=Dermatophagoides pteronyssinus TaxID=6956 RepID=A0ABQ8JNN4_DERPT|nr:hypothetical protein DERP_004351 [Dermatophagoides pteronyssinus]